MNIRDTIRAARGGRVVDLLLKNCRLINVLSGTIHPASVAVAEGVIVGVGEEYEALETIDLGGRFLAPGFIDAHVHLESSMVAAPRFAEAVVPRGTTAVVTDCHEIANVMGLDGIRYMLESSSSLPLDVFVMLPPCVPATPLESSGARLEAEDLKSLMEEPQVIGLGELMNFPGTIAGDPGVLAKLELFAGLPVDGHAPGLSGRDLSAYIAAGPDSDHECTTAAEAEEKLEKGMYLFLREGTGAHNLLDLLPAVNPANASRCCFCTDDRHPADLLERGHMDSLVKMAMDAGVPMLEAIQMVTLNTARRFGLSDRGAVSIGRRADMVVLSDLESMRVDMVFKGGRSEADEGRMIVEAAEDVPVPAPTFTVSGFSAERLRIPAGGGRARVIGLVPGQIVTETLVLDVPAVDGEIVADVSQDVLKIAVVERHHGTGNVGVGFVHGFAMKEGALASSVAHDSHNIIVVGTSDADMTVAVERVIAMGGGQVVAAGEKVMAELALPIAGLMSPKPLEEVATGVGSLNRAAADLGCTLAEPFMTMSFLALPVIPNLKITDMGLVDVDRFEIVTLY